jgi:hypothetical protein
MGGSEEDLKRKELEAKVAYEDKCASYEKHRELAQVSHLVKQSTIPNSL